MTEKKLEDLSNSAIYNIFATDRTIHQVFANYFSMTRLKVNPEQYLMLAALRYGGPFNQQALADFIHKDKATMTRMIETLLKLGYVKRVQDKVDRRNKLISITEKGKQVHGSLHETFEKLCGYALKDIDEKKLDILVDCLSEIRKNLK